jgi:hypothetical protein
VTFGSGTVVAAARASGGHDAFQGHRVDDTGVQHQGEPGNASASIPTYEGTGRFWFSAPVPAGNTAPG